MTVNDQWFMNTCFYSRASVSSANSQTIRCALNRIRLFKRSLWSQSSESSELLNRSELSAESRCLISKFFRAKMFKLIWCMIVLALFAVVNVQSEEETSLLAERLKTLLKSATMPCSVYTNYECPEGMYCSPGIGKCVFNPTAWASKCSYVTIYCQ